MSKLSKCLTLEITANFAVYETFSLARHNLFRIVKRFSKLRELRVDFSLKNEGRTKHAKLHFAK